MRQKAIIYNEEKYTYLSKKSNLVIFLHTTIIILTKRTRQYWEFYIWKPKFTQPVRFHSS